MATINYKDPSLLSNVGANGTMSSTDKAILGTLVTGLITETNRAIAEENIIKNALDGYGSSQSLDGYATIISVTNETNRAIAEENIIKNALDGYGVPQSLDGYATTNYVDMRVGTQYRSTDTVLSTDANTAILVQSLTGYNLGNNKIYNCTLGVRVVIWSTSNKINSGSLDTVVDGYIATNGAGAVTMIIQTTPLLDKSRLNLVMGGASFTVIASTNGFTVSVIRPTGINCTARCNWTVFAFEDIT